MFFTLFGYWAGGGGGGLPRDWYTTCYIHVNNPFDSWCYCAWSPALRESAPGSGACDWPRLSMVAGAASPKFLWRRQSKGAGVGLGGAGGGLKGGGSVGPMGTIGG